MPHHKDGEHLWNLIPEKFQQHTEHGQATRYIGQVTGKNCRPFTQEQQLSLDILFKKAESNRHVSTSSEGNLPHLPTSEYKNNNITRTGKDKHNSRCSQQIVQVRRLSLSPIISKLNKKDIEHPTNSRYIRIINNQATTSIGDSEHKRIASLMDRRILLRMDQRNPIGAPINISFIQSNIISEQRYRNCNNNSTVVAGPIIVNKLNDTAKKIPYRWIVQPMLSHSTKQGKSKKGAQHLLTNRQRFETQRHYLYAMRTLAEFCYEYSFSIDQILSISPGLFHLEVINWFTRWNPSASFADTLQSLLNTKLSLIFDIPQITSTPSKLVYRAVLNCKIINRRYSNMCDIRQLFDYWRSRPDDKDLSETDIQTKLASLLLSICFIRINEAVEINLSISNIDYRNQTAILCISPKANNSIEQYEIIRTENPKVCPNSTFFTWLNHLYWHYGMHPEQIASLFGNLMDSQQINDESAFDQTPINAKSSFMEQLHILLSMQYHQNYYDKDFILQGQVVLCVIAFSQKQLAIIIFMLLTQESTMSRHKSYEVTAIATQIKPSIAQPLALPFYETLPFGRGIEPINKTGARSLMLDGCVKDIYSQSFVYAPFDFVVNQQILDSHSPLLKNDALFTSSCSVSLQCKDSQTAFATDAEQLQSFACDYVSSCNYLAPEFQSCDYQDWTEARKSINKIVCNADSFLQGGTFNYELNMLDSTKYAIGNSYIVFAATVSKPATAKADKKRTQALPASLHPSIPQPHMIVVIPADEYEDQIHRAFLPPPVDVSSRNATNSIDRESYEVKVLEYVIKQRMERAAIPDIKRDSNDIISRYGSPYNKIDDQYSPLRSLKTSLLDLIFGVYYYLILLHFLIHALFSHLIWGNEAQFYKHQKQKNKNNHSIKLIVYLLLFSSLFDIFNVSAVGDITQENGIGTGKGAVINAQLYQGSILKVTDSCAFYNCSTQQNDNCAGGAINTVVNGSNSQFIVSDLVKFEKCQSRQGGAISVE
ncbi:MAG: hypothetical protein EZS28_024691, partial [Streblomastix strix]